MARSLDELHVHPRLGASWEGFALEEVIRALGASEEEVHFWAVHREAELDLLVLRHGERLGFEFKYADAPRLTPSMQKSVELLRLDVLTVVCPSAQPYELAPRIRVCGLTPWLAAQGDAPA